MYLSNEQIGLFGIADKVVKGLMSLITPIPNFILSRSKSLNGEFKNYFDSKQFKLAISFLVLLPICFIFLPSSLLENFIGNYAVSNRVVLNIYSFGFLSGSINIILYTLLIYFKREIEYLYCFLLSIVLICIETLIFGFSIYTPLVFDIVLAVTMAINFYYIKKKSSLDYFKNIN
jgi:O-antigen/teichoic acid export membrane protein